MRGKLIILLALIVLGSLAIYFSLSPLPFTPPTSAYPITITDDLGRNVTIPQRPTKVVSLVPSAAEILFAVGAGDRVVGVTRYADSPQELVERVREGRITVVGGGFDPDIEKIVALEPEIIFINGPSHLGSRPVQRLLELGFRLVALNPNSVEGVIQDILLVGRIMGEEEKAQEVVDGIKEKIKLVQERVKGVPKPRVYIENWHDPLYTAGPGSLQDDMLRLAGGINIFADLPKPSAPIDPEAVIIRDPDVILSYNEVIGVEEIKRRAGWQRIKAIVEDRVYQLDPKEGAPNPRIGENLLKLAKLLHPRLFEDLPRLEEVEVEAK